MIERRKALTMTVILVFVCSVLSFYAGAADVVPRLTQLLHPKVATPLAQTGAGASVDEQRIQLIQQYINDKFLWPMTSDKLTEGALKGMVEATGDKYSAYFNPKEFQAFQDHFKSSFSGIGVHIEVNAKTGLVTVLSPIKGSPGEKAGIKAGDAIIAADGKDIRGMTTDQAADVIRGPKGSKVTIKVQRDGVDDPLTFTIVRDTIEVETTNAKMVAPGVGYLQITEFNEDVSKRVAKAIADLKAQGMDRMILDLRENPGGLLDEAINTSSLFLPAKQPVVTVESKNAPKEVFNSKGKDRFPFPLVVLVDENSASASEIVAGALKDTKIGVLMGVKTFGKGIVQTFYTLPDGSGIKLTTANYLTAGGNYIHQKGIEPDIVVQNPTKVLPGDPGDVQLQKAIDYIKTLKR